MITSKNTLLRPLGVASVLAILATGCQNNSAKLSGGAQSGVAPRTQQQEAKPAGMVPEVISVPPVPVATVPAPNPVVVPPVPVVPEMEGAVTKGSFTVWTEPKDPRPFQDYFIAIKVALPDNVDKYSWKDLSGNLIGTDFYTQKIGGKYEPDSFDVTSDGAVLKVRVPGALALVKDKIKVSSAILMETQEIEIEF